MLRKNLLAGLGVFALTLAFAPHRAQAQASENVMSEAEVERLRAAAYIPNDRLTAFIKILDSRTKSIDDLLAKKRRPGREQTLRELFEQVSEIADELNDNLDDYAPKHRDIRKTLPKLVESAEHWSKSVGAVSEDPAYKVSRKLALDAVEEVRTAAQKMQAEQTAYFLAHPEAAKAERDRVSNEPVAPKPIDIPR